MLIAHPLNLKTFEGGRFDPRNGPNFPRMDSGPTSTAVNGLSNPLGSAPGSTAPPVCLTDEQGPSVGSVEKAVF